MSRIDFFSYLISCETIKHRHLFISSFQIENYFCSNSIAMNISQSMSIGLLLVVLLGKIFNVFDNLCACDVVHCISPLLCLILFFYKSCFFFTVATPCCGALSNETNSNVTTNTNTTYSPTAVTNPVTISNISTNATATQPSKYSSCFLFN